MDAKRSAAPDPADPESSSKRLRRSPTREPEKAHWLTRLGALGRGREVLDEMCFCASREGSFVDVFFYLDFRAVTSLRG